MLAWFLVIGLLGIDGIARAPGVLAALSSFYAVSISWSTQDLHVSFAILGAAFLAVTGGEAMYADMGHFGRRADPACLVRVALPALVLNYFGQGGIAADRRQRNR